MTSAGNAQARSDGEQKPLAPSISLPKGGGAIRGMGEKFAANPVTGTGSMSVPIATSPGRSGFGPQLSLSYDSGAGNGPFGFGWNLSLPAITRKTDKGLPQYLDAEESDVFILSGAEDLVPVLRPDGTRFEDATTAPGYAIRRYRPRIEGLFARIVRWTHIETGDVHWRSLSKDNVLTIYGQDENSRIADPDDAGRVFSWLICETRDDKGNAVVYEYKPEDGTGIDLSQAHERNRGEHDDSRRAANRYLKRIHYGNRAPLLDDAGHRLHAVTPAQRDSTGWIFEVVFDYGEHDSADPKPNDLGNWLPRQDPFSSYRAGFEVRTCRLCQRVLMFHHFPDEVGVGQNCLVRSTAFDYRETPVATFVTAVTQNSYQRADAGGYIRRSLPPLEFEYSQAVIGQDIHDVDPTSIENLPVGMDGAAYQWVDLDGEGLSGVLTEQGGGWFYKRNQSALAADRVTPGDAARFSPLAAVARIPRGSSLAQGAQFLDLAGNGQVDLVELDPPMAGFYERTDDQDWESFRPFTSLPNLAWNDPNLKFVDLTGDGHADVLITEDWALTWYPSLAEDGFGPANRVSVLTDEERGPRVVFADGTQTIFLADLSGDGLSDIARIRNGEVCCWPNLGYGHFGAKVTMDDAPWFDAPDQFDPRRMRLADLDGSGTTDLIYLGRNQTRFWFNQCGNTWSPAHELSGFPPVDNVASVAAVDLLGNGTACLVWTSPLPADSRAPMKYLKLMAEGKPHLLIGTRNNLGAQTRVHYAPSTYFYLRDQEEGRPWITKLPFPVHVVERVETLDHISGNRFVTRYAYHHGYFDSEEREFRGFGMVEQWDTEDIGALAPGGEAEASNWDTAFQMPPVHTKTWFHTGAWLDRDHISRQFEGQYYREPGLTDDEFLALLLPDTHLPDGLTLDEEREACRALKGQMLRQEVYADDAGPYASEQAQEHARRPYSVVEQDFTIRPLQPRAGNRHAVFFTHPREVITYHYERNPADPRIQHALTLEVDDYGNVLKAAAVGYGRRFDSADDALTPNDREQQRLIHITCTENRLTDPIVDQDNAYRTPLPAESRTYELRQPEQEKSTTGPTRLYRFEEMLGYVQQAGDGLHDIPYEDVPFDKAKQVAAADATEKDRYFRRLIEQIRTLYRPDDCGTAQGDALALLPLGTLKPLALPGESYKLAFTPGLIDGVFQRDVTPLLSDTSSVLGGTGGDQGGYVDLDGNGHWWIPSGRAFFSPDPDASPEAELAEARAHFLLPRRYRDPFGQDSFVEIDDHDLLMVETRDALGNRVTVDENDYRVLQPRLVSDPNRNQTEVAFDTLGLVVGTAVMGKPVEEGEEEVEKEGDSLAGFAPEPTAAQREAFIDAPRQASASQPNTGEATAVAHELLAGATTRIVYDLDRFMRSGEPPFAATIARETHVSDLENGEKSKLQISFSYSDGFGREIQQKVQAEPGPLQEGGPVVNPRWVGSGWTIFNNKGQPVRQYEPFFDDTHAFKFAAIHGVSPLLFYDPVGRVIATLHPNHTYEKVVFDPWQQTSYDVNDTCAPRNQQTGDPRTDPDIGGYVTAYFATQPDDWQTWHAQRNGGARSTHEQAAATRAAAHADTPTTAHFDTLGRPFLILAHNRVVCDNHKLEGTDERFATRVVLDIEGNQREVWDERRLPDTDHLPKGAIEQRIVMRYAYDLLGNRIHQASQEAGERWMLNDVAANPIRAWDSRGHDFTSAYDTLRRPVAKMVRGTTSESDPRTLGRTLLTDRIEYGESLDNAAALNLRTRIYRQHDNAGIVTNARLDANGESIDAYDFKGNPLHGTRQLVRDYKEITDWTQPPPLEVETFAAGTRFDALNRPIQSIAPHSRPDRRDVIQPVFNEANLLERLDVWLERSAEPPRLLNPITEAPSPVGVVNIDYDAKGQRQRIDFSNGVSTLYEYDPDTFRLTHLLTRRNATVFPDDDPQPGVSGLPGRHIQNLHYTYDPVGNITRIQDDAQQTIYFKNQRVDPSNDYTYDALYRLIEAKGREHLGQNGRPIPHSPDDERRVGLHHPGDGHAMGTYTERYIYDAVGNFLQMQHRGGPSAAGWTRAYEYNEASLLEPGKVSNRLSRTVLHPNGDSPEDEPYHYDAHGNMARMPHLPLMQWDYRDQLRVSSRQVVSNGGTPEITWYVYDASGQRVRKVTESQAAAGDTPTRRKERLYLGGFEVYREYEHDGETVQLERQTLHLMDDRQRIALVETRTQGSDRAPRQLIRYQHGNHLGSASLELDAQARILSYEEYSPYGSTTYQAMDTETPKRYRYTGMERDEETGLNYHTARYYAPWLGRWASCDPIGIADGVNIYQYCQSNPFVFSDPKGTQSNIETVIAEQTGIQPSQEGGVIWMGSPYSYKPDPQVPVVMVGSKQPELSQPSNNYQAPENNASWHTMPAFQYNAKTQFRHPVLHPVGNYDSGNFALNIFTNFARGWYNLATMPFNITSDLLSIPEDAMRMAGFSQLDIDSMNFALMMTGVSQARMALKAPNFSFAQVKRPPAALPQAQLPSIKNPSPGDPTDMRRVIRELRKSQTPEGQAVVKLLKRREVQIEKLPTDPHGQGVCARPKDWGSTVVQIYRDQARSPQQVAGSIAHDVRHILDNITPTSYRFRHELRAYQWESKIDPSATIPVFNEYKREYPFLVW